MIQLGEVPFGASFTRMFHVHDASGASVAFDAAPVVTVYRQRLGFGMDSDWATLGFGAAFCDPMSAIVAGAPAGLYEFGANLYGGNDFFVHGTCWGAEFTIVVSGLVGGVAVAEPILHFSIGNPAGLILGVNSLDVFSAISTTSFTIPAGELRKLVAVGHMVQLGTNFNQSDARLVVSYDVVSGVGTVDPPWPFAPSVNTAATFYPGPMPSQLKEADFADNAISNRVMTDDALAIGALSIADGAITEAKFGTDALSARVLKADAVAEVQSGVAKTAELAPLAKTTDLANLATTTTGAVLAAAIAAVQADTDALQAAVAAVLADTDDLQIRAANLQSRLPAALVAGKMDATATVTGLDAGTLTAVANAIWDAVDKIEPGISPTAALRVLMAVFAGLSAGVTTGAPVFKSADLAGGVVQGSKNRVIGVQDANDQRTSVTLDVSEVP